MKKLRKGFTLVELMVVIVIIGILAALAIPRFLGATNKAKATEFKPVLKQIYTVEEAYKQESSTGNYGTLQDAGWDRPSGTIPYFGYGLGAAAVVDTAGQTTAMTTAVPAIGVTDKLASATPMTATGQNIKASTGLLLTAADQACVNTVGNLFATTLPFSSLTGATAPLATTATTCQ